MVSCYSDDLSSLCPLTNLFLVNPVPTGSTPNVSGSNEPTSPLSTCACSVTKPHRGETVFDRATDPVAVPLHL